MPIEMTGVVGLVNEFQIPAFAGLTEGAGLTERAGMTGEWE